MTGVIDKGTLTSQKQKCMLFVDNIWTPRVSDFLNATFFFFLESNRRSDYGQKMITFIMKVFLALWQGRKSVESDSTV